LKGHKINFRKKKY